MSGRGDDRISMYQPDGITLGPVARSLIQKARGDGGGEPVTDCHGLRGSVLDEAKATINGERQDVYGSPESSFSLIAEYWRTYLRHKKNLEITSSDVAMMMTLFKVAREANQHKRDNIVDAAGYLGIYADMQERK